MKFKFELENFNINNLDYNNICRFCLSNDGILLPIFGFAEAYHFELTTQIKAILCLEIEENDGLPMSICHSCLYNLEKSNKFKSMCEQADAILRNHIKSPEFKVTTTEKSKDNACQDYLKGIPEENSKPIGDHVLTPPLESVQDSNTNFESPRDCDGEVKKVIEHKIHSEVQHKDISEKIKTKCDGAKTIEENSLLQMEERMNDLEEGMYGSEPFSLDLCSVRLQSESQGQDVALYPISQLTDEEQWSDSVSDLSDEIDGMEPMTVTTPAGNCPGCNKSFSSSSDLERHQHIHKQEPPYPCDYCDQEFDEKAHLKAHWRAHARNKSHMCLTCGEAYVDRADLVKHFAVHDVIKPYHCPSCGKAFAYRSDLRKHAIIHTGARPFKCPICNKTFTRSTNLNKHARVHTGRKPYPCSHCSKMFSSRGDLVRHAVIHTGEKPYACLICSLAFNRKDKLSRHERVHMTDRPFVCAECPTSFHRKEELTKHSRFHHFKPDPEFYNSSTE